MRTAFVKKLTELMREHKDIITLTADMGFSVFENLQKEFPERFINTGVSEQNTVGVAAGLALSGYKVYFYAQAPFATMRCFEQVRLDLAYAHLNVKVVGTASGFTSNQMGVSHFALEDVGLMRMLPGMTVFTPGDPVEAAWATEAAHETEGPAYIRLTKGGSPIIHTETPKFKIGKGVVLQSGRDVTIFVAGSLLPMAVNISGMLEKKGIKAGVVSMPTIKPIDKVLVLEKAQASRGIFTLEDHYITGGLGSAVAELLAEESTRVVFHRFGVPDAFTSITGSPEYLLKYNGLSAEIVSKKILSMIKRK
ncbi:MAG: transketolase C-terminal domain-containing protein [bacterium]|nr:transketolase C-terminal domain-containing protein [bacterium]